MPWRIFFQSLLLGLIVFAPSSFADTSEDEAVEKQAKITYDLQTAIRRGLEYYPGLRAAEHAIQAATYQLKEARNSRFLPEFNLTTLLGPAPDVPAGSGPPLFPSVDENLASSFGYFVRVDVKAVQPIYTFGRLSRANRLAEIGLDKSESDRLVELHDLVFNIKRAYFTLLALNDTQDFLNEIESKLNTVDERIQELLKKNSSEVTETDRLKVKIFRADLETRKAEAEENTKKLELALSLLLGHPNDIESWQVKDSRLKKVASEPISMEQAVTIARERNPKLKQLQNLVDAKKALMEIASANMRPVFFLAAFFTFAEAPGRLDVNNPFLQDDFNVETGGASLGVRQSLDIHILRTRYRRRKAEYDQALSQRALGEAALISDLRANVVSLESAQKRYQASKDGFRAARSWVGAEMNNYEFGLTPTKDVLEAFIGYAKAKIDFLTATTKFNIGVAKVTQTTFRELTELSYPGDGR